MQVTKEELIVLAQSSREESDLLDFKQEYKPEKKAAFWAEIVKDIVAFANSRGGIVVFGVLDDGNLSRIDCSQLFNLDNASLCDQVRKYTGSDHTGLTVTEVNRDGVTLPAILIEPVSIPLVFSKVGT